MSNSYEKVIHFNDIESLINVFGKFDENIKIIETALEVRIVSRDTEVKIVGENSEKVDKTESIINKLIEMSGAGDIITKQNVAYLVDLVFDGKESEIEGYHNDYICLTSKGKKVKAKTLGQENYVNAIKNNTIVFGIGPAGTGKTYLAVTLAVNALRNKDVNRIIITRPAVEAGEKLGFLPGDLQNKVNPYLRPLHDALFEIMGTESYFKYLEKNVIEVAPLAYMRGRTLDDSFIILDEAQNTTPEQMKMFLTRLGFNSKAIVTGDITQIDLPRDKKSGLKEASKILKDIKGIRIIKLTEKDVVRHELVQKIIRAYDRYDRR